MESPLPPDPYKALGVPKDASLATIRIAHRKLVLKTHPDKVQGDEVLKKKRAEEFHLIQQAYEILSDDGKRKAYDDQVKLDTLRAEMMAERGGSRNLPDIRPMSGRSPIVEVRGGRVYEERAPRQSYDDAGDDFFTYKPRESRPKYDDPYTQPSSRKASFRWQEAARKLRDLDDVSRATLRRQETARNPRELDDEHEHERLRWERGSAKAEKKSAYAESTRRRDKTRREDYDTKYRNSRASYVEDGSETSSDSDNTDITYAPKKREEIPRPHYAEVRRKEREEVPRKPSKRDTGEGFPDVYEKKLNTATDYIRQSREPEVELRRPTLYKGVSTREVRPPPSPPAVSDHPRRSSGRTPARRESSPPPKSSAKNRRVAEIVDSPEPRRPGMSASSSDPKGLRGMASSSNKGKPLRASTLEQVPETRQPTIRRSETMPTHRSRHEDNKYSKSSRTKEYDLEYTNPDTPPGPSPKTKSTKTFIVEEDDQVSRDYNTIYVTPDDKYWRERDVSPPKRKSSERPPMPGRAGTSARLGSGRSTSYAPDADELRPPRLKRAETAYVSPSGSRQSTKNSPRQYFGEMPQTEEPYKIVHQSPKIGPNDIKYGRYERRNSDDTHRDWVPGSDFDSRHRPSYGRSSSRVY